MVRGLTVRTLAAACLAFALSAAAHAYPDKPIRLIVPVAAGGGSDILARLLADKVSPLLDKPVIVENQSGGGGVIGIASVVRAAPDGYTLSHVGSAAVMTAAFNRDLPYDIERDLEPIVMLAQIPLVLVVHPSFPANTVQELVARAKATPGQLSFASFNPGGPSQLAGELLKYRSGLDMVHIPYRGSAPALQDVLSGRVPMMFDVVTTSLPHIQAGTLRALAVTTERRSDALPDVPTMIEAGLPDFYVAAYVAEFAPRGTPGDILDRLNRDFNAALKDAGVRDALTKQGWQVTGGSREDLRRFISAELAKWREVVTRLNLKSN
jgi:tripartite-type tricarboxylate transporter receptor subunit TctC